MTTMRSQAAAARRARTRSGGSPCRPRQLADERDDLGLASRCRCPRSARRGSECRASVASHFAITTFCWLPPESVRTARRGSGLDRRRLICSSAIARAFACETKTAARCGRGSASVMFDSTECSGISPCAETVLRDEGDARRRCVARLRDGHGCPRPESRRRRAGRCRRARAPATSSAAQQSGDPDDLAACTSRLTSRAWLRRRRPSVRAGAPFDVPRVPLGKAARAPADDVRRSSLECQPDSGAVIDVAAVTKDRGAVGDALISSIRCERR